MIIVTATTGLRFLVPDTSVDYVEELGTREIPAEQYRQVHLLSGTIIATRDSVENLRAQAEATEARRIIEMRNLTAAITAAAASLSDVAGAINDWRIAAEKQT